MAKGKPQWTPSVKYLDRSCCRELNHICLRYMKRSGWWKLDFSGWGYRDCIFWWDLYISLCRS
ncbi:hypothetical protein DPMN_001107 [Dreissena polymorpha]|uniref:Uncharacterized protein n=1 Tax=Dreissena polymorpha TaxID=45954 RepID=A0A9D4RSM8_DREPO|nr:hypothetical protein DPMN_001107 [Dreissena polymorpha]